MIKNIADWHEGLSEIILSPENLYYYATSNPDSYTYKNILSEDNIDDVKSVLRNLVDDPQRFYEIYKEKCDYSKLVDEATTIKELDDIAKEYNIKPLSLSDIKKYKESLHRKLCTDYCFGVFGEILFYKIMETFRISNLVLSKVQFITAPGTTAHGSDGLFCDDKNKILYFGEAKFTYDLSHGIDQAVKSMDSIDNRMDLDIDFVFCHKNDIKNGYENKITRKSISTYEKGVIIFLLHGEEIEDNDIVDIINKSKKRLNNKLQNKKFLIISFPIKDKESLKNKISEEIKNYDKKYRS